MSSPSVRSNLLPPNQTTLEASLANASHMPLTPERIALLWDADRCPAQILPWLAWALSVDNWQPDWTEQEQRDVIRASLYVHRHKGTIGALKKALRPLGYDIKVREWFSQVPPGQPFTFSLEVGATGRPVTDGMYDSVAQIVASTKNVRSHLTAITVTGNVRARLFAAAITVTGEETTIYPYQPEPQALPSALWWAGAVHAYETITVRPQT